MTGLGFLRSLRAALVKRAIRAPGAADAQLVTVPGRCAGKLCTKKHWLVVGGTAPPTLNTRSTEAFVVKRPPLSESALRASTTVVRVTFDRAFGDDAWTEVIRMPSQHARMWASAAGVSQVNVVDSFGFHKSASRVSGLIRLRTREAAITMWKASGQLCNGTRWFVDVLGDAKEDPLVADVGVTWMPWRPEESYANYVNRVAGQAKLGVVLGRGLGLRMKRSDPAFVRQPTLWRLRSVPRGLLLQDVSELLSAMGFEDAVVCTRHHNRKHYDWCFKATRQDQLQVITQAVQWNPECSDLSEVTAIKEQARRGTRLRPTERLAEPRTISFDDPRKSGSGSSAARRAVTLEDFPAKVVSANRSSRARLVSGGATSAATDAEPSPEVGRAVPGEALDPQERTGPGRKRPAEDTAVPVDSEGGQEAVWRLNARLHENDGGGNCFYLALAVLDTGSKPRHHRQVRRWIQQLLQHQADEYKNIWEQGGCFNTGGRARAGSWEDFLAEQAQNCSWGGALEFDIFCKGLDMRGWVIDDAGTVYSFFPEGSKGFLVLHFDRAREHFRAFTEVVEQHVQARHQATRRFDFQPVGVIARGCWDHAFALGLCFFAIFGIVES